MTGILALDQGTTSTKALLWHDGVLIPVGQRSHRQIHPRAGWVEHDPLELLRHIGELEEISSAIGGGPCGAAGLANQGETVVAWDTGTGRPLHNAIVWQDQRTADAVAKLHAEGVETLTLERAGLPLDPYFSAAKLRWLLDHAEGARHLLACGRLRLGTSDAFFLDNLAGVCATDVTTASRTSLMNLGTLQWDPDLCAAFGVPMQCLPEIRATADAFGSLPGGTPILVNAVDQQAALFGHGCVQPGDLKITFGTGAFALGLAETRPEGGRADGLLPTCAWQLRGQPARYALDGGILTAGAAVEWLGGIGLLEDYAALDGFTGPSALERGLAFVPALAGLGCPHWDRKARGAWLGLSLTTGAGDMRRAVLEGIAFRAAELARAMQTRGGGLRRIAIDGGLSRSGFFCRFLASAIGSPVEVAASPDVTAIGIIHLALAASGSTVRPGSGTSRQIDPNVLPDGLHERYAEAVALVRGWG
ncbi:FGGY family carbohydrate kinase [Pseudoroseomonas globiformis]|uniref:ATP:glycerol 3-phosphotransferase n=1 Tax=Teichococcus globiformis TaxID=2307229 RepID=A0ABV7G4Q3_9PROT